MLFAYRSRTGASTLKNMSRPISKLSSSQLSPPSSKSVLPRKVRFFQSFSLWVELVYLKRLQTFLSGLTTSYTANKDDKCKGLEKHGECLKKASKVIANCPLTIPALLFHTRLFTRLICIVTHRSARMKVPQPPAQLMSLNLNSNYAHLPQLSIQSKLPLLISENME